MRNSSAYVFTLIFLTFFVYFGFNQFEIPTLFLGKTKTVEGFIYELGSDYGPMGFGYYQNTLFDCDKRRAEKVL